MMEPDRFEQIERLYHAALERGPDAREAFLDEACADDEDLRREVAGLIACDVPSDSFIQSPAIEIAARALAADPLIEASTIPRRRPIAGSRIGPYQLLEPLGRGGMGEVHLALDTRLGRKVAVKLLLAEFTTDPERLRRFEQEARAASALNHPNIITIHEIGETDSTHYIVTEYVEGETLRQRLTNAPQIPLKITETIGLAAQIAAALAAAHGAGIIHRDIKPENVMVRRDGIVKVLDFGLAKLTEPSSSVNDSQAATLARNRTEPGVVMGTPRYMAPEQARGEKVDARTDIFSLGVVVYELLAGRAPFTGATASDCIAAILKEEPPELSETNQKVTPQLEKIVRRCLEKQPERRFHSAHDLGFALKSLSLPSSSGEQRMEMAPVPDALAWSKRNGWREQLAWVVAGVLALVLLVFGVAYFRRPATEAETARLFVNPPEKATRFDLPAISPDGRTLAFVATVEGKTQLWVRRLNSAAAKPLAEVGETGPPFWSPDNRFIGFFGDSKLKKIAVDGGAPETLCDTPGPLGGGAWNREGVILFSGGTQGIRRVSANSGTATAVTTVANSRGEIGHFAPVFLPDGQHFIFFKATSDPARRGAYLASLDGGEKNLLLPLDNPIVGVAANPAARNEGYLVFARQGALMAQSFDFSRNQLLGDPVSLAQQVEIFARAVGFANALQASLSANGVLVLIEGNANQQLTWFDRAGKKLRTFGPAGIYLAPRLSHDEQYLAVGRSDPQSQTSDIYLFDLARGTDQRFTSDPGVDEFPLWSPDGSQIVWTSSREGVGNLYWNAASGARPDEALLRSDFRKRSLDWSTDGRFILYQGVDPQTSLDLWVLPLEGERRPWSWLNTPSIEPIGKFSPDGKWIAYQSNESGPMEIYLQAFVPGAPASGGRWKLSTNGGTIPQWRGDGRELYYISADNKLMAVKVTLGAEVKYEPPKELFELSDRRVEIVVGGYAKTRNGQQFLFATITEETGLTPFMIVQNWMAEMKK